MAKVNAINEIFTTITLFDKPALFTCLHLDRNTIPAELFAYDIRHDDDGEGIAATIEKIVNVNHMGTVVAFEPVDLGANGYILLDDEVGDFNFASDYDFRTIFEYKKYLLESGQLQHIKAGVQ